MSIQLENQHAMDTSTAIPTDISSAPPILTNGQSSVYKHVWFITGPAGCGKSTVASYIASSLHLPYLEGDDYHTKQNVEKMRTGIPLTDADRWEWLSLLCKAATDAFSTSSDTPPFATPNGVVVTCSALKRKYRDVMRSAPYNDPSIKVHFVYLSASEDVLLQRVTGRKGHYMGVNMVKSQLESLEVPGYDEGDVLSVDVSGDKEQVQERALDLVKGSMASQGEKARLS